MKTPTMILFFLFSNFIIVSCGSDDDDSGSSVQQQEEEGKNLFSVWRTSNLTLDFRGYTFGQQAPFILRTASSVICTCSIEFQGIQQQGNIEIRDCVGAVSSCIDLIDSLNYVKSPDSLEICDSTNDCSTFR